MSDNQLEERFASYAIVRGDDECWDWRGPKDEDGYGRFKLKGKVYRAHRVALALACPAADSSLHACHTCDNPSCVNPAHLWWGTNAQNQKDKMQKGRFTSPFPTKLTLEDARAIRRLAEAGQSHGELAGKYGVAKSLIWYIVNGRIWKEVVHG